MAPNNQTLFRRSLDKNALYGQFIKSCERRSKLNDKAVHKALDLPLEDDVQITTTTNNHHPANWPAALMTGLALLATGGGVGLTAANLLGLFSPPIASQPAPAAAAAPSKTPVAAAPFVAPLPAKRQQFKVTFWAEDGAPIQVQDSPAKEQP